MMSTFTTLIFDTHTFGVAQAAPAVLPQTFALGATITESNVEVPTAEVEAVVLFSEIHEIDVMVKQSTVESEMTVAEVAASVPIAEVEAIWL